MPFSGPEVHPWHKNVDWSKIADAGHRLAWLPATNGIAGVHPSFRSSSAAMAEAGLIRGAVHTLSTSYVGRGEARHFSDVLGDPTGTLTAVSVKPDGHRRDDRLPGIDQVADFAAEWRRLTSHPLIIRTSWRWWATRDAGGRGRAISPHLWHADSHWAHAPPGWTWAAYGGWLLPTIWSTHKQTCPGLAGVCALTIFTGHRDDLERLAGLVPPPPPQTLGRRLLRRLKTPRRR